MSRFISRLSELKEPLQQLVQKNTEVVWMDHHSKVFNLIIDGISTDCLVHFLTRPGQYSLSLTQVYEVLVAFFLQNESNSHPDGLEIMLDLIPIAFVSKSLSETEKCYSNIK